MWFERLKTNIENGKVVCTVKSRLEVVLENQRIVRQNLVAIICVCVCVCSLLHLCDCRELLEELNPIIKEALERRPEVRTMALSSPLLSSPLTTPSRIPLRHLAGSVL